MDKTGHAQGGLDWVGMVEETLREDWIGQAWLDKQVNVEYLIPICD